jgi:hypothetical protein
MSVTNYFPRWYYPTSVDQTFEDESHIPWDSTGDFTYLKSKDLSRTSTVSPLIHIPVSRTVSIRNKTWFLHCRFQLGTEPGQINGIQVQIQMDRGSRIVDDTIQLDKNGELLGENQATLDMLALKTYGNTWGLNWSNINPYDLTSGNFGLRLRFQSSFTTPHSTTPSIDFIRMRYTVVGESLINKQEARPNIGWTMSESLTNSFPNRRKDGDEGSSAGDGGSSSGGFTGSAGFSGSSGFAGSQGFTGSAGFAGSTVSVQFFGSTLVVVGNFGPDSTVATLSLLPPVGAFLNQAYLVQGGVGIVYWNGSTWIIVNP